MVLGTHINRKQYIQPLSTEDGVLHDGVEASESNTTLFSSPENLANSDLNLPVPVLPSVPARLHERYNWVIVMAPVRSHMTEP